MEKNEKRGAKPTEERLPVARRPVSPPLFYLCRARESLPTATAFEDAPFAALRRVGCNRLDVSQVQELIMITSWIGKIDSNL
jgi:hypothetical protein